MNTRGIKPAGEGEASSAGFVIHGAVHQMRYGIDCVMHVHTPEAVAMSCSEEGLSQLRGETAYFHKDIGHHDYEGVSLDPGEQGRIAASPGDRNNLILSSSIAALEISPDV